ncbi:MAG: metalloregulator ArsR/SmtB family transcription factor [Chloroflexota bacterium]
MKEKTTHTFQLPDLTEPCCSLDINGEEQALLVQIFKALGHPIRFEILKYLLTHPGCITREIVKDMPLAQATISQHLKVLYEAGLVERFAAGTATCYTLNAERIGWIKKTVGDIF